jgi:hypothetical protein
LIKIIFLLTISLALWLITYSLAFVLFRYHPLQYRREIVLGALVMTPISFFIQLSGYSYLAGLIQPVIGLVVFRMVMKFNFVHSAIMVLLSYELCRVIENIYVLIKTRFEVIEYLHFLRDVPQWGDILALCTITISFIFYLHYSHLGFTFISPYAVPRINSAFFISCGIVFMILILSLALSIAITHVYLYVLIRFIGMILLLVSIYVSYRKEITDVF